MRLLIEEGILWMIEGGWLDLLSTYRGSLFGFLKGENVSFFKSKVRSRKLTT
jgi:hypothetical protein